MSAHRVTGAAAAASLTLALAACGPGTSHPELLGASPSHGKSLIGYYGCGACHVIGGIATAQGHVGPPLTSFPQLDIIAGKLPNTTANLVRWIEHPQAVVPGNDMPDLGVTRAQARDIAAYLYNGQ